MKTYALVPLICLSLIGGCAGGGNNEILATVDGEPISIDQFNTYLGMKSSVRVAVNGQVAELPVVETLAFQAMQDLVSRTTLFQMAKDEGLLPSDKDVEDELSFQTKLEPRFVETFKSRGMLLAQIRDEVKFSMVQERLITKGIKVSEGEVDAWIQKNPEALVQPATASLSWVLAQNDARKGLIDNALKSGGKFSDVAVRLSQDPNAGATMGKFQGGPIPINRMASNLRPMVEKANVGTTTEWIKYSEGWAKFYVDAKEPSKKIELTAERKESIRRNLALTRGNKANDLRKRLIERIQASDIVIRRDALKEQWKNLSNLLKAQAEQTTKTAQPTGVAPKSGDSVVPGG
jgi:foldase protein PrsA